VALDATNGQPAWTYRRETAYGEGLSIFGASVPAISGGLLFTGFADGTVVALRTTTGELVWEQRLVTEGAWTDVDGTPVILEGDRVVISAFRGPTVCLKGSTGEELWRSDMGTTSQPLNRNGMLYVAGNSGQVSALDADTGKQRWRWSAPGDAVPQQPTLWRGELVVTTSDGQLYMLNPTTGRLDWQLRPDIGIAGFSSGVGGSRDALFAASDGGWVYAFGAQDFQPAAQPSQRDSWLLPWEEKRPSALR